jgi:hypothetical protein
VANVLSAEDDVIRMGIDPQDPRNIYAAVGWSDDLRLLSRDPAMEIEGSDSEE